MPLHDHERTSDEKWLMAAKMQLIRFQEHLAILQGYQDKLTAHSPSQSADTAAVDAIFAGLKDGIAKTTIMIAETENFIRTSEQRQSHVGGVLFDTRSSQFARLEQYQSKITQFIGNQLSFWSRAIGKFYKAIGANADNAWWKINGARAYVAATQMQESLHQLSEPTLVDTNAPLVTLPGTAEPVSIFDLQGNYSKTMADCSQIAQSFLESSQVSHYLVKDYSHPWRTAQDVVYQGRAQTLFNVIGSVDSSQSSSPTQVDSRISPITEPQQKLALALQEEFGADNSSLLTPSGCQD